MLLGIKLGCFFAGSLFSPFPKHLTTKADSPVSPRGAVVSALRYPALTMTFEALFGFVFGFFLKMAKV